MLIQRLPLLQLLLAPALVLGAGVSAQVSTPAKTTSSVSVGYVMVPFVLTDLKGKPVADLKEKDVTLLVDGQPVQTDLFSRSDDAPVSFTILLDASGSMGLVGKMDGARAAVRALVAQKLPGRRLLALRLLVGHGARDRAVHGGHREAPRGGRRHHASRAHRVLRRARADARPHAPRAERVARDRPSHRRDRQRLGAHAGRPRHAPRGRGRARLPDRPALARRADVPAARRHGRGDAEPGHPRRTSRACPAESSRSSTRPPSCRPRSRASRRTCARST